MIKNQKNNFMLKNILKLLILTLSFSVFAQEYQFQPVIDLEASSVKSQGQSGTCWSFSTTSFLESEIYRLNNREIDIAEMYTVRTTYDKKAWNYVMRQGKTQLSEGGLAHDVLNAVAKEGLVPQSAFTDIFGNNKIYNHSQVVPAIKKILDNYIKNDIHSDYPNWQEAIDSILDKQIGEKPTSFTFDNQTFTPKSFATYLKIKPDDYISITSFTHEKPYSKFVLNIPDNFSNGSFYNVPLDKLVEITINAVKKGYTVALDVDVSEKGFSAKYGVAILPDNLNDLNKSFTEIVKEKNVTATYRQQEFENYNTTDDHLMHITGIVKDQKGNQYFKVKNSWGNNSTRVGNNGYIYMSIPYFRLKTISILLHKDALDSNLKLIQ
jgi:bleomycin hydrolase